MPPVAEGETCGRLPAAAGHRGEAVPGVALVDADRHWIIRSGDAVTARNVAKGGTKIVKALPALGRAGWAADGCWAALPAPGSWAGTWLGGLS